MRLKLVRKCIAVFVLVAGVGAASSPAQAEPWESDLGFYFWLSGLDGTLGVGELSAPIDAEFSELASYVDFAFAGYFEARQPKYILQTDLGMVNLGETRPAYIDGSTVDVDMNIKQFIGEVGAAYRVRPELDLWLAGRFYNFDMGSTFQGSTLRSDSETWADVYVGARYHRDFAGRWTASVRADIGTGGSDFAWFGDALVGYHFTPTFTLGLSYRVLSLDHESSDDYYFKWDIVQNGAGIVFNFSL